MISSGYKVFEKWVSEYSSIASDKIQTGLSQKRIYWIVKVEYSGVDLVLGINGFKGLRGCQPSKLSHSHFWLHIKAFGFYLMQAPFFWWQNTAISSRLTWFNTVTEDDPFSINSRWNPKMESILVYLKWGLQPFLNKPCQIEGWNLIGLTWKV